MQPALVRTCKSYPYFLILDFFTLSRDGGLNPLYCPTATDLNRNQPILKPSRAEQPAAFA